MTTNATAQAANDIRDIKPPLEIPNDWEWLWWTLGALAVLTLLLLVWRYLHRRMTQISVEPPVPAHIRAKQKLAEALALISQPKPFVVAVSDTSRTYLEERFEFRAPERTTEEFLRELGGTDLLTGEQKESLGGFLESCDLVKFAKYEPGEPELRALHDSAVKLVDETEPIPVIETATAKSSVSPQSNKFTKAEILAVIGTMLQLAPIIWVMDCYVSIYKYFKSVMDMPTSLAKDGTNALPEFLSQQFTLANHESWLFNLILTAMAIGLVGLVILLVSLILLRYRAEWFFWFLLIYGLMLCGAFPFGTIFGVFFLVYCLTKRNEFLKHS
jgi:hypothetical protein